MKFYEIMIFTKLYEIEALPCLVLCFVIADLRCPFGAPRTSGVSKHPPGYLARPPPLNLSKGRGPGRPRRQPRHNRAARHGGAADPRAAAGPRRLGWTQGHGQRPDPKRRPWAVGLVVWLG